MLWILVITGLLIAWVLSLLKWRSTNKKIAAFKRAYDLDFICHPQNTVVNNCSEVDEATELHILCCVYCLFELERNPARLDALKMPEDLREFLRSAIAPIDPQEPGRP